MIVLHALWKADSGLCIWGEDAVLPASAAPRRGRSSKEPRRRRHPFACDEAVLDGLVELIDATIDEAVTAPARGEEWPGAGAAESVAVVAAGFLAGRRLRDAAEPTRLTLDLPSAEGGPQASPVLVRDEEVAPVVPTRIAPWTVPALALPPGPALDLLLLASDGEFAVDEGLDFRIVFGDGLRYWGDVARLALELAARGRIVPAVVPDADGFLAAWRPVPTERDAERLDRLAQRMPPVCRAEDSARRAGRSARDLIDLALDSLVDACARDALAEAGIGPGGGARRGKRGPAAGEAWIEALAAPDARITGIGPHRLAPIADALAGWARPVTGGERSLRTCFRLSPPVETPTETPGGSPEDAAAQPTGPWRLEFLLQATDDPSLLVPAAEVWKSRGRTLRVLRRRLDDPQEKLLADLGRALRLAPALESALRTATPTDLELDAEGAHRFLSQASPLLEEAGFGVLVPPWWRKPAAQLGLRLRARPDGDATSASGLLGLGALCAYEWQLALGEDTLSVDELRRLARRLPG